MRKLFVFAGALMMLLFNASIARAQSEAPYRIDSFNSTISIEQDTSITVVESIKVNFLEARHGIFRYVPYKYSANGKNINSELHIISVKDEYGKNISYDVKKSGNNVEVKIGDPDKTIRGDMTYVINYQASNILQKYDDLELYWNVVGSDWDAPIINATAKIKSPYASITKAACYAGRAGSSDTCPYNINGAYGASFASNAQLGRGSDMSIVVALSPDNSLIMPGIVESIIRSLRNNLVFILIPLPLIYMVYSWFRLGRDIKSVNKKSKVPPYLPIKELTPAQVGVIIDQRVDIRDIVAEIVELARLKYITIDKKEIKKKFAKDKNDYVFHRTKKSEKDLLPYQKEILKALFKKHDKKVKMSELKRSFYKNLSEIKKLLYENMEKHKYFDGNPETVRTRWMLRGVMALVFMIAAPIVFLGNISPIGFSLIIPVLIFTIVIAMFMPRRTVKGHKLFVRIKGLRDYLKLGKWRHEIYEKHLFLEEMLPTAVALGVVSKFTRDMEEYGVKQAKYVSEIPMGSFEKSMSGALLVGASGSGKSGWSGGSGFSGGGFGGGGGGSW